MIKRLLLIFLLSVVFYVFGCFLGAKDAQARNIRVLTIDTGVYPHNDFKSHIHEQFNENYIDIHGHGTNVAGIILKDTCSEVELVSCKYSFFASPINDYKSMSNYCFSRAIKEHFDIINYSSSGMPIPGEEPIMVDVLKKGTIIVVAAGNDGLDLSQQCVAFPACYQFPGLRVVGNLNGLIRDSHSNFGLPGMVWFQGVNIYSTLPNDRYGFMSGTSQAAAGYTNSLLKKMCEKK